MDMNRSAVSRTKQILGIFQKKPIIGFLTASTRLTQSFVPMETTFDNGRSRVTLPGWGRSDLDYEGRFRLWQGMSLLELAGDFVSDKGFLEFRKLEKSCFTYAKCVDAQVSDKMTKLHQRGQQMYRYPIHLDCSLSYMGRSSFCLFREVKNQSEESLMTSTMTMVCVDKNTKKPTVIPNWWSENYRHMQKEGSKPLIVQSFQPPDKIDYLYKMTACPTDLDYYGHVNNTSYHRFCVNAAMTAAHKGMLGKIEPHLIDSQVKELKGAFIRDSNQGDDLFIKVWHNPEDKAVFSLVTNAAGEDVYQETMYL